MKKIKLTTPENIEIEYKLADLGSRAAAAIIDLMIQGVIIAILAVALILISYYSPVFWEIYLGWIIGISIILCFMITYGYFIVMELNMNGKTPGKKVLKLRTIRNNGQPLTFKHSAIRNLFRVVIDMMGVGPVFIFFSRERKRIGDYAASTIVVIEESDSQPISLENLHLLDNSLSYYIDNEEYELLRSYFQRRDNLEDPDILRENIILYFEDRFKEQGIPQDLKTVLERM
ncbi:MAG: RDD family protein [Halanaerobiales bacterium]